MEMFVFFFDSSLIFRTFAHIINALFIERL